MFNRANHLALLIALACCVSCTASATQTSSPSTTVALTHTTIEPVAPPDEYGPLLVQHLTLVDDSTLEAIVARPCGERLVEVTESASTVHLRFLDAWDPTPTEGCGLELAFELATITLDQALGDRALALQVPWYVMDEQRSNEPCFIRPPSRICSELTIESDGDRRIIDSRSIDRRPIEIDASRGPTSISLSNDWKIELFAPNWPTDAIVVNTRSLFQPSAGLYGSVAIHNIERDLDQLEPVADVLGFTAHAIRAAQDAGPIRGVTIDTGDWFIDIVVFANPPDEDAERLSTVLSNLTIETRPGQLPLVADRMDWIRDQGELIVTDLEQSGFTISFAIECEASTPTCRPGIGYVSPGGGYESSVSEVPQARWPRADPQMLGLAPGESGDRPLAVDDVEVSLTSFGVRYPLLECAGIPWYDPARLPSALSLVDAEYENWQQSGVRDWTWRVRPGERSGHIGSAVDPEAVVRFVQRPDELWDVVSVTRCQ